MGPVLAVAATGEFWLGILLMGGAGAAYHALPERQREVLCNALNSCPWNDKIPDHGDDEMRVAFYSNAMLVKINKTHVLNFVRPNGLQVHEQTISLRSATCHVNFLAVKYQIEHDGRLCDRVHGGLLLCGDFVVNSTKFRALLVERWANGMSFWLCCTETMAKQKFQNVDTPWKDGIVFSQSPYFVCTRPVAETLVQCIRDDLPRELHMGPRADYTNDQVANLQITNCILFPIRTGQTLCDNDRYINAVVQSLEALGL